MFEQVQKEHGSDLRETRPFEMKAEIEKGRFFIVSGQKGYVANKGETITVSLALNRLCLNLCGGTVAVSPAPILDRPGRTWRI